MRASDDPADLERLAALADVVKRQAQHLQVTDARLFAEPMDEQRVVSLACDVDLSEQVDAFLIRFGRLQDTLADRLLPLLLDLMAEPVGGAIDNLDRAEKLGWLYSVDHWLAARKLREKIAHEAVRQDAILAESLMVAHEAVGLLVATAAALTEEAARRVRCQAGAFTLNA